MTLEPLTNHVYKGRQAAKTGGCMLEVPKGVVQRRLSAEVRRASNDRSPHQHRHEPTAETKALPDCHQTKYIPAVRAEVEKMVKAGSLNPDIATDVHQCSAW
eukprot:441337-Pleurochrysis_carterae.AAC.1